MHRGDIVEKCGYCWTRLSNWRDKSFVQCFLMHFSLSFSSYDIYVGYYGNRGCRECNRGPIPRHYYWWVSELRHSCCLLPTMTLTPRLVDIPPIVPPNDEPPPTALDKAPHDGSSEVVQATRLKLTLSSLPQLPPHQYFQPRLVH